MKILSLLFVVSILSSCAGVKNYLPESIKKERSFFNASWSKNFDPVADSGNLPIALQSPAIDDGIVYIGDNNGFMGAYELENGREIWRVYDGSTYHSAPIVYKDKVIYGTAQGRVIARKAKNGEEVLYNVDLGSPIETAGTVDNGKIFFQLRNHQVFCLDVETGKVLWGFKKSVSYLTTLQRSSRPIVFNNRVYVGFADGTISAINIDEGILLFETKLSTASKFLDIDAVPFVFDNKIYVSPASSNVVIIDPNTGKILRRAEFSSLREPIVLNGNLVFGTTQGEVLVTDKDLNIINKMKISSASITNLVLFKNKIMAGTLKGEVIALNNSNLSLVDRFEFGHSYSAIFSDMVAKEDHLLVISSRNRLFSFY